MWVAQNGSGARDIPDTIVLATKPRKLGLEVGRLLQPVFSTNPHQKSVVTIDGELSSLTEEVNTF